MPVDEPIVIYRGDTWEKTIEYVLTDLAPLNASQWSARAQIRSDFEHDVIAAEMDIEITSIETNTALRFDISLLPTQTALLTSRPGKLKWDLEVTYPDTRVKTIVRGSVRVTEDVTRDA